MHGRAPVRGRAAPPEVRACDRRLERARRSLGPPPRAWSLGAPGRSPPVRAGCLVGRCLARASRERRSSDSGALDGLCHRGAPRGVPGLVSPAGRLPLPAAQTAQRLIAARLADYASAPRGGYQVSTTARTVLNRTRTVSGWRPRPEIVATRPDTVATRPEDFAACGFSDLRAGFVLRDESSRRRRSRAPHGSGCAAPEHGAGNPAPGTRPQPLGVLCTTNWARIPEERDGSVVRGCWPARFRPRLRARPGSRARSPIYSPS